MLMIIIILIKEINSFTCGLTVTCGDVGFPGLGGTTGLPSTSCTSPFFPGEESV